MSYSPIIQNAVMRKRDKKIFISRSVHDFVEFVCDKKPCAIDGGRDYFRTTGNTELVIKTGKLEELCLTEDSPLSEIQEKLVWGSRGKDGNKPLTFTKLVDLETDHLEKILENCSLAPESIHPFIIRRILLSRKSNESSVLPSLKRKIQDAIFLAEDKWILPSKRKA